MAPQGGFADHPGQVERFNRFLCFLRMKWWPYVIAAARQAEKTGKGAVQLDSQMVEIPTVLRAKRLLQRAERCC